MKILIEKQKEYREKSRYKIKRVRKNRDVHFNISQMFKTDPNYKYFIKMRKSKRKSSRNRKGEFSCIFCKEISGFRLSSSLHRHYIEQHYDKCPKHWEKQYYECEECDQTFKRQEHYDSHCMSYSHLHKVGQLQNKTITIDD